MVLLTDRYPQPKVARQLLERLDVSDTVDNLILDLLEWVGLEQRTYQETMEAWRTSCPRLPVWEDANDRALVEIVAISGRLIVRVAPAGSALLKESGRKLVPRPKVRSVSL